MDILTDSYVAVVGFFQQGGAFMYPIAVVLACGLAVALERTVFLTRATVANRRDFNRLLPMLKSGKVADLANACGSRGSAVAHLYAEGLARLPGTRRRQDVEYAMEEGLLEVLPKIERRTPYLATLANIATLLGLLGTIIGLIAAFTAVANADPAEKAALLSASISVAMNTTAFGLMAAIPLLLVHSWLASRTTALTESLEIAVAKFLNTLELRHKWAPAGEAATDRAQEARTRAAQVAKQPAAARGAA